jgi:hypothetical protein
MKTMNVRNNLIMTIRNKSVYELIWRGYAYLVTISEALAL